MSPSEPRRTAPAGRPAGTSPRSSRSPRTARAPRTPAPVRVADIEDRDPMGLMALYSSPEPEPPSTEVLFVECSSCLKETPVSPLDLLRAALPLSLHLPFVRRYPSYMRCPACRRRTWTRVLYRR